MLMGLGNGMGSGLIMTIGADLSPNASRATFPRRVASDRRRGNGVGPLAVAVMTSLTALGPAIVVMGGVAWLGAASSGGGTRGTADRGSDPAGAIW